MKQSINETLYAYWNGVRQNRPAPRRFEIEPSHIAGILPNTFILERVDSETFRYRLAGTALSEMFRAELRDTNFIANFSEEFRPAVERLLASVTLHCGAGIIEFEIAAPDGRTAALEAVLLPLVHTRGGVDRVLGSISPAVMPDWLGHEIPSRWRMTNLTLVWPDGQPVPSPETHERQEPFLPHIRKARIVRSERRQFRVYDGGLSEPPKS